MEPELELLLESCQTGPYWKIARDAASHLALVLGHVEKEKGLHFPSLVWMQLNESRVSLYVTRGDVGVLL